MFLTGIACEFEIQVVSCQIIEINKIGILYAYFMGVAGARYF